MANNQEYEIDGYIFTNAKDAKIAANELKGVEYIRKQTKFSNPNKVLTVYNKLVTEGIFHTPVGLAYIRELQKYLLDSDAIDNNSVKPIVVEPLGAEVSKKRLMDKITTMFSDSKYAYREKLKISYGVNIILILAIIAMFIITNSSDNINILNYEEKLIDKYAAWEDDLTEREAALRDAK